MTTQLATGLIQNVDLSHALNLQARFDAPFRLPSAVVYVLDRAESSPAAAWYEVNTGDVYIDLSRLPVEAANVSDSTTEDFEIVKGVLLHELAHSRWSNWMKEDVSTEVFNTLVLFEEGRIERNVVNVCGESAMQSLRLAFSRALLPGFSDVGTTPYVVAANYALVAGRVHAGHIGYDEVIDVELAVRTVLGDDVVDELDELLGRALVCRTDNEYGFKEYAAIAAEWNELLKTEFGKAAESVPVLAPENAGGDATNGTPGETRAETASEARSTGEKESVLDESETDDRGSAAGSSSSTDEIEPGKDSGHMGNRDSVDGAAEDDAPWLDDMDASKVLADALDRLRDSTAGPMKFDRGKRSNPSEFSHVFASKSTCVGGAWRSRDPKPAERKAATLLTRMFEEMSTPAIIKRKAAAQLPPGRLRSRDAVRMSADRAAGRLSTAQPWRVEKRKHDTAPPITVGIATDTSGSMKWAEEMVASTAWIFAMAGHRIGANVAAVTFGNEAEAVVKPHEMPTKVNIRRANGGIEAFDDAMAALDGVLHYTDGRPGRKVLVIVSDAHFVRRDEDAKRRSWMQAFKDANTEVIWVNNDTWSLDRMLDDERLGGSAVAVVPGDYEAMVRTIVGALNR